MTAPAPSPAEAAVIDRFGIFDEERIVEEVARAMHDAICQRDCALGATREHRAMAVAAITAYRATQDGGAQAAVWRETVVMCTHGGLGEHPWRPGEGCPDALAAGTWSVR